MINFHIQNAIALRQLLLREEKEILRQLGIMVEDDVDDADYVGDRLCHLDDLLLKAAYDSSFTAEDLLKEFQGEDAG